MIRSQEHIDRHDFLSRNTTLPASEKRTLYVIILTTVTMVVEITAGYITGSMALLADGWHMFSHAGALTITFLTYRLAKSNRIKSMFSFGTGKFLSLGGYTSAIILAIIAVLMFIESGHRLLSPTDIMFREAIIVAIIGLLVNLLSAWILGGGQHIHLHGDQHGHHHPDQNLKAAYFHVLADALTSILAILGLIVAYRYAVVWIDPLIGIVGSIIILKWSYSLSKSTAFELLDRHPEAISVDHVIQLFEQHDAIVEDLHFWNIAPSTVSCSLIIRSQQRRGTEFYREIIEDAYQIDHLVIEEKVNR